jgi:hypothetical protein
MDDKEPTMYKIQFSIDQFSSSLAGMDQHFSVIRKGEHRVRVREQKSRRFVGQLDERRWFVARSRGPFEIKIKTDGSGQDEHLTGITILKPELK